MGYDLFGKYQSKDAKALADLVNGVTQETVRKNKIKENLHKELGIYSEKSIPNELKAEYRDVLAKEQELINENEWVGQGKKHKNKNIPDKTVSTTGKKLKRIGRLLKHRGWTKTNERPGSGDKIHKWVNKDKSAEIKTTDYNSHEPGRPDSKWYSSTRLKKKNLAKEENLQELSKKTLKSYYQKRHDDMYHGAGKDYYKSAAGTKLASNKLLKKKPSKHKFPYTRMYGGDWKKATNARVLAKEEENLQELSKKTLSNYFDKGLKSLGDAEGRTSITRSPRIKDLRTVDKRVKGLDRASDRLAGKLKISPRKYSMKEENLQELSKKTLGSYVKKAADDVATKSAAVGRYADRANKAKDAMKKGDYSGYPQSRKDDEFADKMFKKSWKRRGNINKAVDKLTKEEKNKIIINPENKSMFNQVNEEK